MAPAGLRILQLNLAYDRALASASALLNAYRTLTGWSRALVRAGASVEVVQRFSSSGDLEAEAVRYHFVADEQPPLLEPWAMTPAVVAAVADAAPDVVHINGLMFPGMLRALRQALPHSVLVMQDHSGAVPRMRPWPLGRHDQPRWREAFECADAFTFTAADLASRWHIVGLPPGARVIEIVEASTELQPVARAAAIERTGVRGTPAIVWVGRLDDNKDPLMALDALDDVLAAVPAAHCWMIYGDAPLEARVRARIASSPVLRDRVTLIGAVAHECIVDYLSAADVFLSASHHEGSGYALIEAMACGDTPCVTAIPAHLAIVGDCGRTWPAGDAAGCAGALVSLIEQGVDDRARNRNRFERALSWDVIGRHTLNEYAALASVKRRTTHP